MSRPTGRSLSEQAFKVTPAAGARPLVNSFMNEEKGHRSRPEDETDAWGYWRRPEAQPDISDVALAPWRQKPQALVLPQPIARLAFGKRVFKSQLPRMRRCLSKGRDIDRNPFVSQFRLRFKKFTKTAFAAAAISKPVLCRFDLRPSLPHRSSLRCLAQPSSHGANAWLRLDCCAFSRVSSR